MRKLNIPMTKAAKDRLALLRTDMPIPMDPEKILPFSYRFQAEKVMCLTFEGRDVAYVPDIMNADKKSFDLLVLMGENENVDMAIQRTFARITNHLNGVGQVLAAEKRAEKAKNEADQEAANAERNARTDRIRSRLLNLFSDEDTVMPNLTRDILRNASVARSDKDLFSVTDVRHRDFFDIRVKGLYTRLYLRAQVSDAGEVTIVLNEAPEPAFLESLGLPSLVQDIMKPGTLKEIIRIAERNVEALKPERLIRALRDVPDTKYAAERLSIGLPKISRHNPYGDMDDGISTRALTSDISLRAFSNRLAVYSLGAHVLDLSFGPRDGVLNLDASFTGLPKISGAAEAIIREHLSDSDVLRLSEQWVDIIAEIKPDTDLSGFLKPDMEVLVRESETMDAGYGF